MEMIHFTMDGPQTVQKLARRGDWATSLDLKSAFNHLRVNESLRPFLCFAYHGQCYAYQAVPFGARHSTRYFTEALGYALKYIRAHWTVRIMAYMDDLLLLHQDREQLELETLQIAVYLQSLGWTLSTDKCEFTPKHEIRFLGWSWDFNALTLQMTPEMRRSMLASLHRFDLQIQHNVPVTCKKLGSLIGSLNFLRAQFPRASLYLRTLHSALAKGVTATGWFGSAILPKATRSEVQFWSRNVSYNSAYNFSPRTSQAMLTTDASELGWGAVLEIGSLQLVAYGFFSTKDSFSWSHQRETAAVLRALLHFRPFLVHYAIRAMTIRSDNAATVCNLQRQGAGVALLEMTRQIFKVLTQLDIRIRVMHLPGLENTLADALSRMDSAGDYSLKQEYFLLGLRMLGFQPSIDLFAHRDNAKCLRYAALPGPGSATAAVTDAFTIPWNTERPYIFPPVQIIPEVLQKIQDEKVSAVVVVPHWLGQPWWNQLMDMHPRFVQLGTGPDILQPGPTMIQSSVTMKLPPGTFWMAAVSPDLQ
jgi:hypothetical protein